MIHERNSLSSSAVTVILYEYFHYPAFNFVKCLLFGLWVRSFMCGKRCFKSCTYGICKKYKLWKYETVWNLLYNVFFSVWALWGKAVSILRNFSDKLGPPNYRKKAPFKAWRNNQRFVVVICHQLLQQGNSGDDFWQQNCEILGVVSSWQISASDKREIANFRSLCGSTCILLFFHKINKNSKKKLWFWAYFLILSFFDWYR